MTDVSTSSSRNTMDNAELKALLNNCSSPKYTRIKDLRPRVPHKVTHFAKVQSRYGEALCATVEGEDDALLNVYLPRRFFAILTDAVIESYNSGEAARLSLMYSGVARGIEFV